ncbi:MAG: hypothetical protein Unbinned838contig1000_58 [Prokaryotic dsDNA virus sp.]|nr:MAG: hypothetical protein Unbinned838contig1000_58 [Prokaryotic dsDNA virus sp.]|tara:strand:- start:47888 stop:48343 length:456 start_codon:yes stop_codon:yes gene_type:complete
MNIFKTLAEAKQYLRDNFKTGTECPCCGKYVKAYKRKLNAGMARALIIIYKLTKDGNSVHVQSEFTKLGLRATTMDYAYLEKWSLIEQSGSNGYWKITQRGKEFVEDDIDLPEYALVYNGNVYKWADNLVNIETALTEEFDLDEIMKIVEL